MSDPVSTCAAFDQELVRVENLCKRYPAGARGQYVYAAHEVSFSIGTGEALGLVGESGSGKSTIGRLLLQLEKADSGTVHYAGRDLSRLSPRQMRPLRKDLQIVFQDPASSLNGRMRVGEIVGEPILLHHPELGRAERLERVRELIQTVGLDPAAMDRFPFQFSGGQRQRIGIARALACNPRLIVADEPITALDVSTQAQIVNLMMQMQRERDLAFLFISHDLRMVRHLCKRMLVMLRGRIVEFGLTEEVCAAPRHPYTRALLGAVLDPDPDAGGHLAIETYDVNNFDCRAPGRYVPVSPTHGTWEVAD